MTPELRIHYPDWVAGAARLGTVYADRESRVRLAIALARENVERRTGGPFGAAIFERDTGRLVSIGMNLVLSSNNSVLHGEVVAIMMAQSALGTFTLGADGLPAHELVSSCEPCAMCLGATLWSGVRRLVCSATSDDARAIEFDEGPVFADSYRYLEQRGIEVVRGVLRPEGAEVLARYKELGGAIYNP